jgi:tetratricopeptide (TPR) repeat protein
VGRSLVGREGELRHLVAVLEDAAAGRGCVALVTGEPGIGKTRLAEEVADRAEVDGFEVHWATCWEGGGTAPYSPWAKLLRSCVDAGRGAAAAEEPGASAALGMPALTVLTLVSDLTVRLHLPSVPAVLGEGIEAEEARLELFGAIAAVFQRAATVHPLLLVLDDLHWADPSSLLLLRFVARELHRRRLLILGTYRDVEVDWKAEQGRLLAALAQEGSVVRLGGLDLHSVGSLIADVADVVRGPDRGVTAPDPGLVAAIHQRSGGNPLFVVELARLLAHQETVAGPPPALALPRETLAVLERRLALLSQPCCEVLTVAAACGELFRAGFVAQVAGLRLERILELLEEAARARIIVAPDTPAGRHSFGHALIRDALYGQAPLDRRAAIHQAIGEALERAPDASTRAGELAHHFLRSATPAGAARAVSHSERAGRQALDVLAYEEAAGHFARAVETLDLVADGNGRRLDLLLALGDAQLRSGDLPAARNAFREAAGLARGQDRPSQLALAALGLGAGPSGFEVRLFDEEQVDLLGEALRALGPADSKLRAWTLARLSVALSYMASPEYRRALSDESVGMARRLGDRAVLAYALAAYCDAIAGPAHARDRLHLSGEIIDLARETGDRTVELLGRRLRLIAHLELGDIPAADAEIEAFARSARTLRQALFGWYVPLWKGMRALMQGHLADATHHATEAESIGRQAHSDNAAMLVESQRISLALEWVAPAEAESIVRSMLDRWGPTTGARAWLTGIIARAGRRAEARAMLDRQLAPGVSDPPEEDAEWLPSTCQLVEACAVVGDEQAASLLYERLLPHADRFAVDGIGAACLGSTSRHLGLLAGLLGRTDAAAAHFEQALAAHRRAGASLLVAHTLRDYGAVLQTAADPAAAARASVMLDEAAGIYLELGLDHQANALEALCAGAAPAVAMPPPGSSPEANIFRPEGEIWTLAYAGKVVRLRDSKGLHDIARLLADPQREIHVVDLIAAAPHRGRRPPGDGVGGPQPGASDTCRGDPVLDTQSRREYRRRFAELQEELDEAAHHNDPMRVERARAEMDFIAGELAAALGLGGRPRRLGDPAERVRKAVRERVRTVLRRLAREHPDLARHLEHSIRTGTFCCYSPEHPMYWTLH